MVCSTATVVMSPACNLSYRKGLETVANLSSETIYMSVLIMNIALVADHSSFQCSLTASKSLGPTAHASYSSLHSSDFYFCFTLFILPILPSLTSALQHPIHSEFLGTFNLHLSEPLLSNSLLHGPLSRVWKSVLC